MAGSVMFLTRLVRTSAGCDLLLGDEQCFSEQSLGTCMSPDGFGFYFFTWQTSASTDQGCFLGVLLRK